MLLLLLLLPRLLMPLTLLQLTRQLQMRVPFRSRPCGMREESDEKQLALLPPLLVLPLAMLLSRVRGDADACCSDWNIITCVSCHETFLMSTATVMT